MKTFRIGRFGIAALVFASIAIAGCKPAPEVPDVRGRPLGHEGARSAAGPRIADFRGRRVAEMTVVVFRERITAQEWRDIFEKTGRLSAIRTEVGAYRGRILDDREQSRLDSLALDAAEIVIALDENSAVYLLNVGAESNCRFTDDDRPRLACESGAGIPATPDGARIGAESPGGRTRGETLDLDLVSDDFRLTLRLRPEGEGADRYYGGESIVADGSIFPRGEAKVRGYRYGYAEVRFE